MLQLFYDDFLSFVPLQLPQLLDVTTMSNRSSMTIMSCSLFLLRNNTIWKKYWTFWKTTWR